MRRIDTYNAIKLLLCKYGAIPPREENYEKLITELLTLYFLQPQI